VQKARHAAETASARAREFEAAKAAVVREFETAIKATNSRLQKLWKLPLKPPTRVRELETTAGPPAARARTRRHG
jgi:hypothetical protein